MKNKKHIGVVALIVIALFSIEKTAAQTIKSWGSYIHVRNYNGAVERKAFILQLEVGNKDYLNSELLIAVKVNSPIANSRGVFNAEKLKIRLNNVTGGVVLPNASS